MTDNTVYLCDITNTHDLAQAIIDGWVDLRPNIENPDTGMEDQPLVPETYCVACYSRRAQLEGHWQKNTTMLCRGLILDLPVTHQVLMSIAQRIISASNLQSALDKATVISRGMQKFFTVEMAQTDWGQVTLEDEEEGVTVGTMEIDTEAPAWVSDKIDGALAIGVPTQDKSYVCFTKGSPTSGEALFATQMLHDCHQAKRLYQLVQNMPWPATPLFEVVAPIFDHIVDYGDFADVCFLGLVENKTGIWHPWQEIAESDDSYFHDIYNWVIADRLPTPETMDYASLDDALRGPARNHKEGMVVTLKSDSRQMYKIKYEQFLELQRIMRLSWHSVSSIVSYIPATTLASNDKSQILDALPQAIRASFAERFPDADEPSMPSAKALGQICDRIIEDYAQTISETVGTVTPYVSDYLAEHTTDNVNDPVWRKAFAQFVNKNVGSDLKGYLFMALRCVSNNAVNIAAFADRIKQDLLRKKPQH